MLSGSARYFESPSIFFAVRVLRRSDFVFLLASAVASDTMPPSHAANAPLE